MHILSFITQNQLIIFTSNSKVDNIEVLSRVQSYLVLIHHTYDLTSYLLSTYLPTYLPTYLLTSRTIKVFYTLYFIQCDQIWRFFKVPCKSSQKNQQKFRAIVKNGILFKTSFWATFGEDWATFYSNIWSHRFCCIIAKSLFHSLLQE